VTFLSFALVDYYRSYVKISDLARMDFVFKYFPAASLNNLSRTLVITLDGVSTRFIREIPLFGKYFVYYRILSWSDDGRYMYMQAIFTIKGNRKVDDHENTKNGEIPSIIPEDEVICAILYICNTLRRLKGRRGARVEDLFRLDGFDAYDEQAQKTRKEGWEYVKDLHESWERRRNLRSARKFGAKL